MSLLKDVRLELTSLARAYGTLVDAPEVVAATKGHRTFKGLVDALSGLPRTVTAGPAEDKVLTVISTVATVGSTSWGDDPERAGVRWLAGKALESCLRPQGGSCVLRQHWLPRVYLMGWEKEHTNSRVLLERVRRESTPGGRLLDSLKETTSTDEEWIHRTWDPLREAYTVTPHYTPVTEVFFSRVEGAFGRIRFERRMGLTADESQRERLRLFLLMQWNRYPEAHGVFTCHGLEDVFKALEPWEAFRQLQFVEASPGMPLALATTRPVLQQVGSTRFIVFPLEATLAAVVSTEALEAAQAQEAVEGLQKATLARLMAGEELVGLSRAAVEEVFRGAL